MVSALVGGIGETPPLSEEEGDAGSKWEVKGWRSVWRK